MLLPLNMAATRRPSNLDPAPHQRRDRRGARAFGDEVLVLDEARDGRGEIVLGHGLDPIDELLDESKGDRFRVGVAAEAVGNRRPWNDLHEMPGADAGLKRTRHGRLDADHLARRRDRGCRHRDAADQAAAADWHDQEVDVRSVLENLEREGGRAGDDVLVVVRRDELRAFLRRERLRLPLCLVVIGSFRAERRAVPPDRVELGRRCICGREHDQRQLERFGGRRERAPVISGRGRDQPRWRVPAFEAREDRVERAARLERVGELQRLELQPDIAAGQVGEPERSHQRRPPDVRSDPPPCAQHVNKVHGSGFRVLGSGLVRDVASGCRPAAA